MIINGTTLKEKKNTEIAWKQIYGIGLNKSIQLNTVLGLSFNVKLKEINKKHLLNLNKALTYYKQGIRLQREVSNNISTLKEIKTYRGIRHSYFLPVRGQRTHTNAGTQKNKKKKKKEK